MLLTVNLRKMIFMYQAFCSSMELLLRRTLQRFVLLSSVSVTALFAGLVLSGFGQNNTDLKAIFRHQK